MIALCTAILPFPAAPQATPSDGNRAHLLVGAFAGRLDLHGAGETDLIGGRAGIGFGELLQLTGFYWRGVDRSEEDITADYAWGGELQFNLNTGFGLTPFLVGGVARVDQENAAAQTAAVAGAGLVFPLGPVLVHAGARDYMYGVEGLRDSNSPEDVTHNWLYSAGITFALGQRRPRRAVVARPPAADDAELVAARRELDALRQETARLAAQRDTLLTGGVAPAPGVVVVGDTAGARRSYHSTERIVIPIPTEGSITLRYGPETAAAPVIVAGPSLPAPPRTAAVPAAPLDPRPETAVAAAPLEARPEAPLTAAPLQAQAEAAAPIPPPAGARLDDPAVQSWIQQIVATEVARQAVVQQRAEAAPLTQAQMDAIVQRVTDGVMVSVVPRMDAAQAQRINALREELRFALAGQRSEFLGDIARREAGAIPAPGMAPAPVAPAQPTPVAPAAAIEQPAPATTPAAPGETAAAAAARDEAAQRTSLAAAAAAHPAVLSAAETERGPAAVLGDVAFESGATLVSPAARTALTAVAQVLRAHPDRRVYVHGHTDAVGAELSNQRLSELRAESVRSLLVQDGIEADRIFVVGYGQARPVADNATARGRALNRRVEIVVGESRHAALR
ncbi:MAG TPA: OmpA family protein [Longimicrobiales bacterium]|nr:OmpA family protein [Longimicrobiales bacterium]